MRKCVPFMLCTAMFCSCNNVENNKNDETMSMNEKSAPVIEAIMSRRSIRAYKPEQIKPEQLNVILECAINAPSAMNRQPWALRVIQDKEILDKLTADFVKSAQDGGDPKMIERVSAPNFSPIFNAPTFILIAYDTNNKYGLSDCGMLAQNILLAAESMNIGTCTIGGFTNFLKSPEQSAFVEKLNLPEGYELHIGVAMGYKDQSPEAKPRDKEKIQFVK